MFWLTVGAGLFQRALPVLCIVLFMTDANAQNSPRKVQAPEVVSEPAQEGFRATVFRPNALARFRCIQAGRDVVNFEDVVRILPDRVQGKMTYSLLLRDGTNVVVYTGRETTCVLSAKKK